MGTLKLPVPVKRSGENFSPRPLCAPPPEGADMEGDLLDIGWLADTNYELRYEYDEWGNAEY